MSTVIAFFKRRWPQILMVAIALWLTSTTPNFYSPTNLSSILTRTAIVGVLAIGQCSVLLAGGFDLSQGATLGLACAVSGTAMSRGYHPAGCAMLAIATGLTAGWANGFFVAKVGTNPFVTTLSSQMIIRGLTFWVLAGGLLNRLTGFQAIEKQVDFGSIAISGRALIFIITTLIAWLLLRQTIWGQHLRATGGNTEAARLAGVRTDRMKILSFTLSGFCAGLGSIMQLAFVRVCKADTGANMELESIASCVIGGVSLSGGEGSILGAAWGCFLLKTIETIITIRGTNDNYRLLITGALILTFAATDAWSRRGRRK
jgi:ribose/xylose/arabinose/galactoside ABC-type transport system permease subunit